MKRFIIFGLSLVLFFSLNTGSVFAKSQLNEAVDKLLGIRYKWGGETTAGFDCSGFTRYVFNQFGISLPHSSKAQSKVGTTVSKQNLRAGDLVFFNTDGKGISHVGIYLGNEEFIHASSNKGVIKSNLNESYYVKRYVTATRILSEEAFVKLTTEPEQVVKEVKTSESEVAESDVDVSLEQSTGDIEAIESHSDVQEMRISKVR